MKRKQTFNAVVVICLMSLVSLPLWHRNPVFGDEKKADSGDGTKEGNLARGVKLWAENCRRCHNLRDAKDLNDADWNISIMHMRIRAGLTGQDARDILKFMQSSN